MNKPPRVFYQFDSFRVDANERQLWQGEKLVSLTPKVFDILLVLLENKGNTVEKDELIKMVWADTYVEEGSLNRNISTLRKALGDDLNEQKFIKTLPKRGYRFTANVEEIFEEESLIEIKPLQTPTPTIRKYAKIIFAAVCLSILTFSLIWAFSKSPKSKIDLSLLTENERQQLAKFGSANIDAYENYVKGRLLWHSRSAEDLHQSIIYLESAVKIDPHFALAHSALADAYAFDTARWREAELHAREAIKLAPNLGEPHATIGFVQMFWEWKLIQAKDSLRKAVELNPDYATAHQWYAINLVANRSGGAALAEMKRAIELEPNSLAINADLCQLYFFLQKYDFAISQCNKTLEKDANFLNAHVYLYEIYTAKEMYNEAIEKFFKIEQLKSDFALPFNHQEKLRTSYKHGGIRAFWQTRIEYLEQNANYYELAKYYFRLGNKEKALNSLQKSYKKCEFDFIFFFTEPVFRDLDDETQFKELARALEYEVNP